jgi:hypothetical protein
MTGILKNLLKTFAWAVPVSFLVNLFFFQVVEDHSDKNAETGIGIELLAVGSIYLNIVLLIINMPALFLNSPRLWEKPVWRIVMYFAGPVIFIIGLLVAGLQKGDVEVYFLTAIVFIFIQSLYYKKLLSRAKVEAKITEL